MEKIFRERRELMYSSSFAVVLEPISTKGMTAEKDMDSLMEGVRNVMLREMEDMHYGDD